MYGLLDNCVTHQTWRDCKESFEFRQLCKLWPDHMTAPMGQEEDSKFVRHKKLIFGILAPNDTENNLNPDSGKELTMFAFSYFSRNSLAAGFLGVIRLKIRQKNFGVGCWFSEIRIMCQVVRLQRCKKIFYQTLCFERFTILPNNRTTLTFAKSWTCQKDVPPPPQFRERHDSNLWLLGEKHKHSLCAVPPTPLKCLLRILQQHSDNWIFCLRSWNCK